MDRVIRIDIDVDQAQRWISLFGGGALTLYGLTRRSWSGLGLALLGSGLAYLGTRGHWSDDQAPIIEKAPVVHIVNTILRHAVKDNASEIHIEPEVKGAAIRYRIDGMLRDQMKVPHYVLRPMVQRIKVLASIDILNRRTPQKGRIGFTMHGKKYVPHVSTFPTEFGEKVVINFEEETEPLGDTGDTP